MKSLFQSEPFHFDVLDATIIYYPNFFDNDEANLIFNQLKNEIPWQQDEIRVFGKTHLQPRLTALFGNEDREYAYSSIKMKPHPWNSILQKLKLKIETLTETSFTSVLLNYYRDGKDSNGWHADNEKQLGENPVIASISFGAERVFQLKHNSEKNQKIIKSRHSTK